MNHNVSLKHRLQYFDACVSPAMLFSLTTLPMTQLRLWKMDTLQRKMIRRIVGWRRVVDETWQQTMSRMKQRVSRAAEMYSCTKWSHAWAQAQWRYAMHICRSHAETWMRQLCKHNVSGTRDPESMSVPHRSRGRPRYRWDHYLQSFCDEQWPTLHKRHWHDVLAVCNFSNLEQSFVEHVVGSAA